MKKKKLLIAIGIIFITIIIIIVLLNKINNKEQKNNENSEINEQEIIEAANDGNNYYVAENCATLYVDAINREKINGLGIEDDAELLNNYKESILGILDKKYIEDNKIKTENIFEYVNKIDSNAVFTTLKVKNVNKENIKQFIFYGFIQDIDYNYLGDLSIIVNIDINTNCFSIIPILENNVDIDNVLLNDNINSIESNDYNEIMEEEINDEYVAKRDFDNFKNIFIVKNEVSYNYIEQEYKNKKFSNINDYENYSKKIKEELKNIQLKKYKSINDNQDYTEYICVDQYGNYYIFKDKGVMDYTVMLDTYTIDSDEFNNKYNNGSDQLKVGMNLEKIFQALNRKDYNYIYEKLDNNFKQNNFSTLTDFETYAKNTFFDINKIEYGEFEEKSGVYVYKISLSDATESSDEETANEEKKVMKNFIVKLEDNNDFKMAFNVD